MIEKEIMGERIDMRLSVIVPFYNVEKYIEKCVRSLFEQTYKDMEIIFVDDGGTDGSLDIIVSLIHEYSYNNCLIIHKTNGGLPQARKTGVEASKGDYIAFVDSDDWLDVDFYEKSMEYIERNDGLLYCTGYQRDYDNGKKVSCEIENYQKVSANVFASLVHQRKLFHSMWSKIFRRDAFMIIRFPKGNFVGEDYVTLIPFIHKIEEVFLLPVNGYHYRQLSNSMGNSAFNHNKRKGFIAFHKIYPHVLKWHPDSREAINNFYMIEYMALIVAMGKNNSFENKIFSYIRSFIKRNAYNGLKSNYVEFKYKASLVAIILFPRLFALAYGNLLKRFT